MLVVRQRPAALTTRVKDGFDLMHGIVRRAATQKRNQIVNMLRTVPECDAWDCSTSCHAETKAYRMTGILGSRTIR